MTQKLIEYNDIFNSFACSQKLQEVETPCLFYYKRIPKHLEVIKMAATYIGKSSLEKEMYFLVERMIFGKGSFPIIIAKMENRLNYNSKPLTVWELNMNKEIVNTYRKETLVNGKSIYDSYKDIVNNRTPRVDPFNTIYEILKKD